MCEYTNENKCKITSEVCPYMYFCDRFKTWRASKYMPKECPVEARYQAPKGYNRVIQERNGYLYIAVDDKTIRLQNPFDNVPLYVKVYKQKNGQWKLRK